MQEITCQADAINLMLPFDLREYLWFEPAVEDVAPRCFSDDLKSMEVYVDLMSSTRCVYYQVAGSSSRIFPPAHNEWLG